MDSRRVVGRGRWVLVLLLAAAAPLEGQAARLLGRVTDGVGNPVAEARVVLVAESAADPVLETVSGATGGFQFAAVQPGTYTLRAARDGFAVHERRVTVRPGQVVSQVMRLLPARPTRTGERTARSAGR